MRRPTLKDIARDLRVSESYVSKVLSGHKGTFGANPARRDAVMVRARELGFRKNRNAAALACGKHGALAVFIHHLGVSGSAIVEEMVRGIAAATTAGGQRLWLSFFERAAEFQQLCPPSRALEVDGLVVAGCAHAELVGDLVAHCAQGVPVVTIHDEPLDPRLPNVGCDQKIVGALAVQHLLERGSRRLAILGPNPGREEGACAAVAAAGLSLAEQRVCRLADYTYEAGRSATEGLLTAGVAFNGIVAHSDQIAIGALHVLLAAGKRVPEDVRIIGVDNSPFCEFSIVPLSSISQGYEECGRRAVRLLLDQTQDVAGVSASVAPVAVVRRSTA